MLHHEDVEELYHNAHEEVVRLRKVNDDLLAALEDTVEQLRGFRTTENTKVCNCGCKDTWDGQRIFQMGKLRNAIAKAKEQTDASA